MRFLFISFFLFFCIISNAQNVRRDRESFSRMLRGEVPPPIVQELKEPVDLKEQIESFITFLKNGNYYSKYSLYIIKVYDYDTVRHDYCFSMRYIANSYEYSELRLTHYFMIGDDAVVLNASNPDIESLFSTCDINTIEKKDVDMLINHLTPYPNSALYQSQGMIYCKRGKKIRKTYYPFVSNMPVEAQIYFYPLPREFPGLQIPRPQIRP